MTVYALHSLTSVSGPHERVAAISGMGSRSASSRRRDHRAKRTTTRSCLLDFGDGVLAIAHGTAAGTHTDEFAAGRYFGTEATIAASSSTASRSTSRVAS